MFLFGKDIKLMELQGNSLRYVQFFGSKNLCLKKKSKLLSPPSSYEFPTHYKLSWLLGLPSEFPISYFYQNTLLLSILTEFYLFTNYTWILVFYFISAVDFFLPFITTIYFHPSKCLFCTKICFFPIVNSLLYLTLHF